VRSDARRAVKAERKAAEVERTALLDEKWRKVREEARVTAAEAEVRQRPLVAAVEKRRAALGWSFTALAKRLHCVPSTYKTWLAGQSWCRERINGEAKAWLGKRQHEKGLQRHTSMAGEGEKHTY
jgi:hypothetical protein